ncbi:hypothetical protein [Pectinatus frisingensis]|jgi:hypothetical protein|uniref:hypothetical protein n=1 Tax=Pectinatus frisingensis TaxID=865 RepID=UPI0018C5BEC5|nr:hypothetical protein [Pectinatus frisingensis]
MRNFKIDGNSLIVNGNKVDFQFKIDNVKICNGLYIVLVDIPSNIKTTNNVYAVNENGHIVWQVQDVNDVYLFKNDVPYVGIRIIEDNFIIATNYNGVTVTVNSTDGKIVGKGVTK